MKKITLSKLLFSLFLLTQLNPLFAQDIPVTIQVQSNRKDPVPFASVLISSPADSNLLFRKVADSLGQAQFSLTPGRLYRIQLCALDYDTLDKHITIRENTRIFRFTLEAAGKTLDAAVLRSTKPLMRQEDDKTIVDPENLAAASTSGYEVLEKTPGLFMDQDGNIYISSLSPATVQINGRDMRMSAADIASMLKSLPPNAIQKIEIVRTPSARYDAGSSGGVVNVVLRKGIKIGLNGSVNTGWQQGRYGNQFAGFNLNHNDGKKSVYINLNYTRRDSYENLVTDRFLSGDTLLGQDAFTRYPGNIVFGNYGINWTRRKWDFEISGQANFNASDNQTDNRNQIRKTSNNTLISYNLNQIGNQAHSRVIGNGFESKLRIDSTGSEWSSQVFYFNSFNRNEQDYQSAYTLPVAGLLTGDGTLRNNRELFSARTDLKLKLKHRFTLESGLKSSIHQYTNKTEYFRELNGQREQDPARTNRFNYQENIHAGYLQGAKTFWKDVVLKFGTRLENTYMRGRQLIPSDTSFLINRTDFFPYVYLSRSLVKIAGYELRGYLVYRRTITRPVYEQLNPFSRYVDAYMSEQGNPSLRPQFTRNFEANISVDERPIIAVGINNTKDIFTNVVYQSDTSSRQAYRTYDNLGRSREWYFRAIGALPPGGRYFLVIGTQYNHNDYQGLYENKPIDFKRGSWVFFTYQTFRLDKKSVFTLNGFLRLKGQQQFYELGSFGALNASLNRKFIRDKLIVTLSINDIFLTNRNNFSLQQGSINASGVRRSDTRRGGITLRYNFGIRKKEERQDMIQAEQQGQ